MAAPTGVSVIAGVPPARKVRAPQGRALGNTQAAQADGKWHRNHTASGRSGLHCPADGAMLEAKAPTSRRATRAVCCTYDLGAIGHTVRQGAVREGPSAGQRHPLRCGQG